MTCRVPRRKGAEHEECFFFMGLLLRYQIQGSKTTGYSCFLTTQRLSRRPSFSGCACAGTSTFRASDVDANSIVSTS